MNMGSYPQDLISIHFLKCICNNINLWKHYLRSICYIFMELSYTRHVYSICCSLLQNFLICIMLDSAVCTLIGTTPYVCVCSYNNHMYILKQCNWFLDCQTSSMIKILIQVVSLQQQCNSFQKPQEPYTLKLDPLSRSLYGYYS